ncbi:macrophage mannose receptor 1-like isoform X2 [Haliotis rufescens]|uniref:macrophage mannose receptor 1-like isoform X2 n=1 Tax=Haliotis rufescens TaxID=6454 RepID=UPI00201F43FC|nr:macrophage mannose receptor 1-like isoform X2 [Haliotis rufescens]
MKDMASLTILTVLLLVAGYVGGDTSSPCPTGPGWVTGTNYCYYFNNKDTVSWSEATQQCDKRMAKLLTLDSVAELDLTKKNMAKYPSDTAYWTSLNDLHANVTNTSTRQFRWGNGQLPVHDVVSANWDKETSDFRSNCASLNAASTLSAERCAHKLGYICQMNILDGACPFAWSIGTAHCYFFSDLTEPTHIVSWTSARTNCRNKSRPHDRSGGLIDIDNPDSAKLIQDMRSWPFQASSRWWTGLTDRLRENEWRWSSGSSLNRSYVNWTREPDNIRGDEHCVTLLQKGTFSDRDCNQTNNYICRKMQFIRSTLHSPVSRHGDNITSQRPVTRHNDNITSQTPIIRQTDKSHVTEVANKSPKMTSHHRGYVGADTSSPCPTGPGWVTGTNYCYYFNNKDTVSWADANDECSTRMAKLLRLESVDEWTFVKNNMAFDQSGNGFWTALNDIDPSGTGTGTGIWLWGNDEYPIDAIVKSNWDKEPDNNDDEDCIAINLADTLSDEHCSRKMGYICELNNDMCPFGWIPGASNCYFVSNTSDPTKFVTWDAASSLCQDANTVGKGQAHLLTVNTAEEASFFAEYIPTAWSLTTTQKWWTDLTDKQTEGSYKWMNGDVFNQSLVRWTQEPNNIKGREHCATMLQKGTFSDRDCTQTNNYICRKEIPTQQYTVNFGCGDWERAGHKCYQAIAKPAKSWSDAQTSCKALGGNLMKIENQDEMHWLSYQSKTAKMSYGGYWIGLNDQSSMDHVNWNWADGSKADTSYLVWNQEPDDLNGDEDCAAMGTDGVYTDWNCDHFHNGFICEKQKKNQTCPPNWVANSDKSQCYLVASNWTTWREASGKCVTLSGDGSGALLAIDTQAEKDFILGQLAIVFTAPFYFWTGLTDSLLEGLWQYSSSADNTQTSLGLIKWNSEPNNWHHNEHCVSTAFGGRLNDATCSHKSGYICEKYATGYSTAGLISLPFNKLTLILMAILTLSMGH